MDLIDINALKESELQTNSAEDSNSPFSYLEWKRSHLSLIEKNSEKEYNLYLLNWFSQNKKKTVSQKFVLRQKYLYLLDQLKLFFTDKEKASWYNQINLADDRELLLGIPYFAKRLKEISLYYLSLRKKIQNSKIKHNLVGSIGGLQHEIYSYLLETFALSAKNQEHSPAVFNTLPLFSDLQNKLTVTVEELYDDKHYFDISPTQSISKYFDFSHNLTGQYLATKGIVLSSAESFFKLFDSDITGDDALTTFNNITGTLFEATDSDIYTQFIQKYLAETKYTTSYVPELTTTNVYTASLAQGDNQFFYPYGNTSSTFSINQILPIMPLSTVNIEGATGGDNSTESDVITVRYKNTTKSAWLKNVDYVDSIQTIKARMNRNSSTSFIFPYPGYGLSGQDVEWTGPTFETSQEFNFLKGEYKASVNQAYWSQTLPLDTCEPLLLNNSNFVYDGAISNKDPRFADQFYLRDTRSTDTTLPQGNAEGAWLFKFTEANLPVSSLQDNVYLWPYIRINLEERLESHLEKIDFTKACNEVSVQDIPTSYFVAASSIENADKIYKLNNYGDPFGNALECAWLSAVSIENEGYRYAVQDGFVASFAAGESTRFIWNKPVSIDPEIPDIGTQLEDVFKTISHKADCPFATNNPKTGTLEWENCTCKQVYHSPFGHSQDSFAAGNYFADCVLEVSDSELSPVDFSSWRDSLGRDLTQGGGNLKFAWYKTVNGNSWGKGRWVTNSGTAPFELFPGKSYVYIRANAKTSSTSFPSYAVTYSFDTKNAVWVEAKKDPYNSDWISTNNVSKMKLFPGDFIGIQRRSTVVHELLSGTFVESFLENKGSIWSTYDTVPVNCKSIPTINISWPKEPKPFNSTNPQYPPFNFSELARVEAWAIRRLEDKVEEIYVNPTKYDSYSTRNSVEYILLTSTNTVKVTAENPISFNDIFDSIMFSPPTMIGTYMIGVTARKTDGTIVEVPYSTIPAITCTSDFVADYTPITFETPTCGFLLEKTLKGWNYNKNKIDILAQGARPYWAVLYTEKNATTRYKGVYSWGYPNEFIDEYLPDNTPRLSPIEISYGSTIDYERKGPFFIWNQPIDFKEYSGTTQWCLLSVVYNPDANTSSLYGTKEKIEPSSIATSQPSDILLSNFIEGDPLQVFYHANNAVTWNIEYNTIQSQETSAPLSSSYVAANPSQNLTNRFNPTIAAMPVLEETYSLGDTGGYFLPQNLGASQFINKNFSIYVDTDKLTGTFVGENPQIHIGGRGLTQEEQFTIYDWTEDNQWMKESITTGVLAGSIKKGLTKSLQTFIPYQSNIDVTTLGLITTETKLSPWGGINDSEWIDPYFDTTSFTGIRSVSAWAIAQVIKEAKKDVEYWTSDIYGNQYGIFKSLNGVPFYERTEVGGELWIKLNNQIALPATKVLSKAYELLKGLLTTEAYNDFYTGNIQIVNCYFNTLFLKTPNVVLFINLSFDYETQEIQVVFDDIRWILLDSKVRYEKSWFFSTEKKVVILVTEFLEVKSNTNFYPYLYELDLNTNKLRTIFELTPGSMRDIFFKNKLTCAFSYDKTVNKFLITYSGIDVITDRLFLLDYYINNEPVCRLHKCVLYEDRINENEIIIPPFVSHQYLTTFVVGANTSFNINIPATNNPTTVNILNNTSVFANVSAGIINFRGTVQRGVYHVNYSLQNKTGESIYCLTLQTSG